MQRRILFWNEALQSCANVGVASLKAWVAESVVHRGRTPVSSCKTYTYVAGARKWLEISQALGNSTFCRTSSFHRNFHSVSRSYPAKYWEQVEPFFHENQEFAGANSKGTLAAGASVFKSPADRAKPVQEGKTAPPAEQKHHALRCRRCGTAT